MDSQHRQGGSKRGKIATFSPASRRNLLYTTGKVQRAHLPYFITLTYPNEYPTDAAVWKNHLRCFWQRVERRISKASCIWKLEPQGRGAPHFHMLAWGLDGIPLGDLQRWIAQIWFEVVGSGDKNHYLWHLGVLGNGNRPCVQPVENWRQVISYAAKYLGKSIDTDGWEEPGRFWGIKNRDCIPWAVFIQCAVNYQQAVKLLRLMRGYMHCKRAGLPSLTMLTGYPERWFFNLDSMIGG